MLERPAGGRPRPSAARCRHRPIERPDGLLPDLGVDRPGDRRSRSVAASRLDRSRSSVSASARQPPTGGQEVAPDDDPVAPELGAAARAPSARAGSRRRASARRPGHRRASSTRRRAIRRRAVIAPAPAADVGRQPAEEARADPGVGVEDDHDVAAAGVRLGPRSAPPPCRPRRSVPSRRTIRVTAPIPAATAARPDGRGRAVDRPVVDRRRARTAAYRPASGGPVPRRLGRGSAGRPPRRAPRRGR